MNMTEWALNNRKVTYFALVLVILGGIASFFKLGKLEDPEFSVKAAVITTQYPGASAAEVEKEVTDRIELALQEVPEIEHLYSVSRAGISSIKIDIEQKYRGERLAQIWDDLRKKVRDIENELPPGAKSPEIGDDFGFVYGFLLALSTEQYNYAELEEVAKELKKNLSLINGISRAELWGVQPKVVYIDISEQARKELGLTHQDFQAALQQQNAVVDAGHIDHGNERIRIYPTGNFNDPSKIADLLVSSQKSPTSLLRIGDVAEVSIGYQKPVMAKMHFNGKPAIGIALANQKGVNVLDVGEKIESELARLQSIVPLGMNVDKISWQSELVDEAIDSFMISLIEAILIVLLVLTVPMGWRIGLIIGSSLILTILATFIAMAILDINLQRMSLGALVVALGMMVDNAIVVADGMLERLKRGMDRRQAAIESAKIPGWPLFGATLVAVMAFYPIFASTADAGEYCRVLFIVAGLSLSISWLIAMTVTPLQCVDLLPQPKSKAMTGPESGFLAGFRRLLLKVLKARTVFLVTMALLLAISIYGFQYVNQMFFPDASRAQFMVDIWEPAGTRIEKTEFDANILEAHLLDDPRIESVSSFIGMGPPRFYLPVDSEGLQANYGQLIVNVHDRKQIDQLIEELQGGSKQLLPHALIRSRKYGIGPADTWKFEARFIGTADTTTQELRQVAEKAMAIVQASPLAHEVRTDIQNPTKVILPQYSQSLGLWSGVSREEISAATRIVHDGLSVGLYRKQDNLYPIVLRSVIEERQAASDLTDLPVNSQLTSQGVPLSQVVSSVDLGFEDYAIVRWDRRRAVTVQASPKGVTYPTLHASVAEELEALELPDGWTLFWDGELESSRDAQEHLSAGVLPAVVVIISTIVLLFNAYRPPFIILLTIPFALIGITGGLLLTGAPFGFMALLGAMSLSGMMIKNSIVLLDQINLELAAGKNRFDAVVDSCVSRLTPVVLAAATTVLGVIPLLQDVFWVSMSATIMFGLTFGTILTMLVVPALYCTFYRVSDSDGVRAFVHNEALTASSSSLIT
ncbi:efflux RND transporter permease subunit [Pseudomonadota bacterium]